VIVVSHRGPFSFTEEPDGSLTRRPGAGGVASALSPLLTHRPGTTWIAAAMGDGDRRAAAAGVQTVEGLRLQLLALDPQVHRLHYDVVSNATLWFLYHGLFDLPHRPRFDARWREAWDAYRAINQAFADAVCELAGEGEIVLVQDYQLALVAAQAKARRPDLRTVLFTHTPFCGPNSIRVLPDYASTELLGSMASIPCGFHTQRWANAFAASAREVLGAGATIMPTFVAALGPDADAIRSVAESPDAAEARAGLDALVGDRRVILRTDRIEPSKNIVRGFLAYELMLEQHPELRGDVVFVAYLYGSRESLAEYLQYRQEVAQTAERVNARWRTDTWTPILVDTRDDFARSIAGLTRYDALLVNPIKDGLNLVAKEGPLVNARDGVLCLSRDAGAFDELQDAVQVVHPYDLEQTADALHTALTMRADERAAQAEKLRALAGARDPERWLDDLVRAAG
jgi:trehalose 6-phosphate synthase